MSNDEMNPLTAPGHEPSEGGALSTEFEAEIDTALDPLAGAGSGKKLNSGLILLVAVVLIAAAGLFSMKKLALVTASNGFDANVESQIEEFFTSDAGKKIISGDVSTEASVLTVIGTDRTEIQVPLRDVQRDPFEMERRAAEVKTPVPGNTGLTEAEIHAEACLFREQQLVGAAQRLEIKACMQNSLAIVNGQTKRIGESIEVPASEAVFEVLAIGRESITVHTSDANCDLEITEEVFIKR